MSKFFNVQKLITKAVKALPRSKKVSPTIKSVPRTKLSVKESLEKVKSKEYLKRIHRLDEAEKKVKTGKQMMKEGQKERKKMKDTGTAFQFRDKKSYHPLKPGEAKKFKVKKGMSQI